MPKISDHAEARPQHQRRNAKRDAQCPKSPQPSREQSRPARKSSEFTGAQGRAICQKARPAAPSATPVNACLAMRKSSNRAEYKSALRSFSAPPSRAAVVCLKTPPLRAQSRPEPPVERIFRRGRTHKGRIHTRCAEAPSAYKPNVSRACSRTDSHQLSRKPHAFVGRKGAEYSFDAQMRRHARLRQYEYTLNARKHRRHT